MVRFNEYGDIDVLHVVDVDRPVPASGEVLVAMKAASINPGEAAIRKSLLHEMFPATFPSGEGSDVAGEIEELGEGVTGFDVGQAVIGFTENGRATPTSFWSPPTTWSPSPTTFPGRWPVRCSSRAPRRSQPQRAA